MYVAGLRDPSNDHGVIEVQEPGGSFTDITPVGSELFLPGAAGDFIGAYQATSASDPAITYAIFHRTAPGSWTRVWNSASLTPTTANAPDTACSSSIPRIGDYTSLATGGSGVWAAWTDTSTGRRSIDVVHLP